MKWEARFSKEREEEEMVERRAEGRSASAITRRTGAEKRRSDITIVMRKKRVLKPLIILLDFSSFEKKGMIVLQKGKSM